MNRRAITFTFAILLSVGTSAAFACEYTKGETKYADYAHCRYGEEAVLVIDLPESSSWDQCVYLMEAFRPEKLLAVTKDQEGKENVSINDRAKIGNPCYLTKQSCDAVLKAHKKGS